MVVAAIITILSAIVFSSQTTFNSTLTLANTAYDIALTIRSAQTFGVGGRIANTGTGIVANVGYGVHFDASTPGNFSLFADTSPGVPSVGSCHGVPPVDAGGADSPAAQPGDCIYSVGSDLQINGFALGNGITVSDFCAYGSGVSACASSGLSTLDLVFARPNQDAFVTGGNGSSHSLYINGACVTVSSPQGNSRYISISSTGQINANAAPCP